MNLSQTTAPTSEPLTVPGVRQYLRIDDDRDDPVITDLIKAARGLAETSTRRQLMRATWKYSFQAWPDTEIVLPHPPLSSVSSITYLDTAGDRQTWSSDDYDVQTDEPGRIRPAYGEVWPAVRHDLDAIQVTYLAGYASASAIPELILLGMRLLIGHWLENREATAQGINLTQIPLGVEACFISERGSWGIVAA